MLTVLLFFIFNSMPAQEYPEQTAPGKYRIVFTNKDNSVFSLDDPSAFLSPKSLERRSRQGIPVVYNDLPVTPAYIDSLRNSGAKVLTVSKWFNSATISVTHDSILDKVARMSFVEKKVPAGSAAIYIHNAPEKAGIQLISEDPDPDYGPSWWQTAVHNGHLLHNSGYRGNDMMIALLDAGFYHVNQLAAFSHLWDNGQIIGTRDFVDPGADVFSGHTHGMIVLSVIGGLLPGELVGTATDADFWLLRSEDGASEFIVEEDNWVAAAEFADSIGADIISSSLGYTQFNDPLQDHSYADMNGNTTRVSRSADMAASKGMLVVVSAGNQGNTSWKYIGAPADADSILAVGAVDQNLYVADFSSRGPSSDGNVKPDVMAIGKGTYVAGVEEGIRQGNGTSLSAPIIAGLSACLWQANPGSTAMEVLSAIRESSDRYANPDEDYGHGIPDFNLAHVLLQSSTDPGINEQVTVFPNPFRNELYILFGAPTDDPVDVILFDLTGKEINRYEYPAFPGRKYLNMEGEFNYLPGGIYILKVKSGSLSGKSKLVRF